MDKILLDLHTGKNFLERTPVVQQVTCTYDMRVEGDCVRTGQWGKEGQDSLIYGL